MTPARYEQLRSLYLRVAELPPNERLKVLDGVGAGDPSLREELESVLVHSDVATGAFRDAVLPNQDDPLAPLEATVGVDTLVPEWIGGYRVIRRIAQGGMGTVFEAEQDRPRRRVALKVLNPGMAAPDQLLRFEHESHILGLLQHPFIARVLEAGSADLGGGSQPYFAMEFVDGVPLIEYAITERLSTEARLSLFVKIGEAVQYAHQHGVIHRDLKPDNILVDSEGCPKVLDFGVARITGSDLRKATLRTDMGQLIGTVPYMSPEQATGDPRNVDFRSDVYALGVVLFELLTGRLPYDVKGLMIYEVVRVIREDAPLNLGSLNRRLRGDLETIVVKALEKDKQRRYQSVLDLVADVRRFQSQEPILARPASGIYQIRKLIARHRAPFAGAAVLFMLLIAFSGWMSALYARASRAEQLAQERLKEVETARDESESVSEYLQSMLSSVYPENLGRDVLVRDVLDGALTSVEEHFTDRPLTEARLRDIIGKTYFTLGLFEDAEIHQTAAAAINRRERGARHPMTLDSINNLALTLRRLGKFAASGDLNRRNYEMRRRVLGEDHTDTLQSLNNLASTLLREAHYAESEALYARALPVLRSVHGEEHERTLDVMNNLAISIYEQGRYAEANVLYLKTLEIKRSLLGEEHSKTLNTMNNLALVFYEQGRYAEAEQLHRETLEARRRLLGEEHPDTLVSLANLGYVLHAQGRYADADVKYRDTLEIAIRVHGQEHFFSLNVQSYIARLHLARGRYAEAERWERETLDVRRRVLGNEHRDTLRSLTLLAIAINKQGRHSEATKSLRHTVQVMGRVLGEEHPITLDTVFNLTEGLADQGRTVEAEELCLRTLQSRRRVLGEEHPDTLTSIGQLAGLLTHRGELDEAERLYRAALENNRTFLGKEHPTLAEPLLGLAQVLLKKGSPKPAHSLVRESIAIRRAIHPEDEFGLVYSRSVLGECLTALGHYEDAEPLVVESYDRLRATHDEPCRRITPALKRVVMLYEAWGKSDERKKYKAMLPR